MVPNCVSYIYNTQFGTIKVNYAIEAICNQEVMVEESMTHVVYILHVSY